MKLSDLKNNEKGIITKVKGRGAFRNRIVEMGFIKGKEITVIRNAPLKDPIEYNIMGYEISLRRSEADLIEVLTESETDDSSDIRFEGVFSGELFIQKATERSHTINVALVGNPNSGKTTLFNYASGAKERVGNYSGVTVDAKTAKFKQDGYTFNITDLPGTYSLTAYSPEEVFVRKFILDEVPDVIINIIDASNLERNLYLTTQLIDMDFKVVVALNMYDELLAKGARFDYESLGKMIGIPFVPTVSSKGRGINQLFNKVIEVYEDHSPELRHIHINYGPFTEKAISVIQSKLRVIENFQQNIRVSSRFMAIKLLEKDKEAKRLLENYQNKEVISSTVDHQISELEKDLEDESETIITDAKYGFISGALKETYIEGITERRQKTEIIDTFITHKIMGFPIFLFFMWVMFQATFSLGKYPMDGIQFLVDQLGHYIKNHMETGMLKDLLVDGVIGGVGGVIVFLPNILILFFFISLMEDTGYMARVAFIMDKIMHKIGLHGKSFIPLIMGFGCNVPAVMATRTLVNRNDRLLTMLINPLMSCSARLPIYLIITGAIFAKYAGLVLFGIYLSGIALAIFIAILFKKTIFKAKEIPFVMELPPYRIPTVKSTLIHMWNKGQQYIRKMGGIILIASVLIWTLGYFPRNNDFASYKKVHMANIQNKVINDTVQMDSTLSGQIDHKKNDSINRSIEIAWESERQGKSYIGRLGRFIEPVISPLGFDWKMGVSLISGVAAKEIVVSTMGVLYQADTNGKDDTESLKLRLQNERIKDGPNKGQRVFTPLSGISFMLFILIYFPCIATVAAISKESGSWKWAAFTLVYTTILAWMVSFLVFQVGSLFF